MSWKTALSYVKADLNHHGVGQAPARSDATAPMGARIGGLITLPKNPLIRAAMEGSLIEAPTAADFQIKAISHVRLNVSGDVYRFYTSLGDQEGGGERFVQVFQGVDGEVKELMYCSRLTRVIPENEEDQNLFTGANGEGLGECEYSLWKEQMADVLNSQILAATFGEKDQITYQRDVGSADTAFVAPFTGRETRLDDGIGEHSLEQQIYYMPYVRTLSSGPEYLLVETEIVSSQNGDTTKRGIHVDFMIGIPLERGQIVIQ